MSSSSTSLPEYSVDQTPGERWRSVLRLHWGALLVGALFVLLSLIYNVTIPAWEADNELSHYNYVRYIVEHRALPVVGAAVEPPVISDMCRSGEQTILAEQIHQFRQPPLYYLLGAATTFWVDAESTGPGAANPFRTWDPRQLGYNFALHDLSREGMPYTGTLLVLHLLRLLSGLLALGGLLAMYLLGLLLFDGQRPMALAMMAVNAFIPQYVFASAIVNNDILIAALSSWCVFFCAYAVLRDSRPRSLFLPALLAALAITAKYNGLVLLLPVGLTTVVVLARFVRKSRYRAAPMVAGIGLMTILASVPALILLAYNKVLYGRFFGSYDVGSDDLTRILQVSPDGNPSGVWYAVRYGFSTFWGQFGWDTITLPAWINVLLAVVCVLAVVGVVLFLLDRRQPRRMRLLVLAACFFLAAAILQSYVKAVGSLEPRGRYMFPALSAICFLLVLGLHRLLPQRLKLAGVTAFWVGLMLLAIAVPVFVLKPAYATPHLQSSAELLPGEQPLDVTIGSFAQLLGYRVEPKSLANGDPVQVTLVWKALQSTPNNYTMSIHLLDANSSPRAWVMSHPAHGNFPTSIWRPGDVFRDTYQLYWADTTWERLPGQASLKVALFCPGTETVEEDYLRVSDSHGEDLGDAALFGRIKVFEERPQIESPTQSPPIYTFGDEIALQSYEYRQEQHLPGQPMIIQMQWRALQQPRADYTVFAHLVDAQGQQVAGNDQPLTDGYYPSSLWAPGETISHTQQLPIMTFLPPGHYTLEVGVYDPQSLQRLPLWDRNNNPLPDDQFDLAVIPLRAFRVFIPMVAVRDDAAD